MKRVVALLLIAVLGLQAVGPALAGRRAVREDSHPRTVVVVHRDWPLGRAARMVVVRPPGAAVQVAPAVYLKVVVWTGVLVAATASPARDILVWQDGATLARDEDWTEFTLHADRRGSDLWFQVKEGRVQFDWAEVVFENGDARVVDMKEWTRGPGLYHLLDLKSVRREERGRVVDHVRMVARAKSDEARVVLMLEK